MRVIRWSNGGVELEVICNMNGCVRVGGAKTSGLRAVHFTGVRSMAKRHLLRVFDTAAC